MGEKELIGMADLMAAEVMKEDTDAREVSYNLGDQVEVLALRELPEEQPKVFGMDFTKDTTTLEVKFKMTRLALYSLLHGRKITNNWLKLHGGVMVRKGAKYIGCKYGGRYEKSK